MDSLSIPWTKKLDAGTSVHFGEITEYIVAPSCFHHMFVGPWKEHHPKASVCAPNGLKGNVLICRLTMIYKSMDTNFGKVTLTVLKSKGCRSFKNMYSCINLVNPHRTDLLFFFPFRQVLHHSMRGSTIVNKTVSTPLLFKSGYQR